MQGRNANALNVVYYEGATIITTPENYITTTTQTIRVEVVEPSGCTYESSFDVVIDSSFVLQLDAGRNPLDPNQRMEICDEEELLGGTYVVDGLRLVTAEELTDYYFSNFTGGTISYFEPGGRDFDFNTAVSNTVNLETRATSLNNCDSNVVPITVTILSPPSGITNNNQLDPLRACGIEVLPGVYQASFDLTQNVITGNDPLSDLSISYHRTLLEAQQGLQPLASTYQNDIAISGETNTQIIYVRIHKNSTPSCPVFRQFELRPDYLITENTNLGRLEDLVLCETTDGSGEADFYTQLSLTSNDFNASLFYRARYFEALDGSGNLDLSTEVDFSTISTYIKPNNTNLFVLIENIDANLPPCSRIATVTLYVDPITTLNPTSTVYEFCGDTSGQVTGFPTLINDDLYAEVVNADDTVTLLYYDSLVDAL